jgi:colicin import membrane protein
MTTAVPYSVPEESGAGLALVLAIAVHAALLLFLWTGVRWQNEAPVAVEAEVWDISPPAEAAPPPPPEPAPPEPVKAATPPVEKPDVVKPDIALEQEKKRKEQAAREEEARLEKEKQEKRLAEEKETQKKERQQQRQDPLQHLVSAAARPEWKSSGRVCGGLAAHRPAGRGQASQTVRLAGF